MRLQDALARRWKQAAIVFLVLFAIVLARILFFPVYQSEALVLVNLKKGPTTTEVNLLDPSQMLGMVRVHSHLLQSSLILKKVILDLQLYKEGESSREAAEPPSEKKIQALVSSLRSKNLVISSPPFTNLIEVRAKHRKPQVAADIANTLLKDYLDWNVKFEHEEADRLLEYLENETAETRKRLADADLELRQFKAENRVTDLSEEIRAYFQILPERFKSHYQVIQAEEIKLLDLGVERSRLKELYTEESPQIQYLDQTIGEVKQELKTKLSQIAFDEDFLSGLNGVPEKEMNLARLTREVKTRESLYIFLLNEKAKAGLLKQKETVESVKVVSWADVPTKPSGRLKKLLSGFILSGLFALLTAVVLEAKALRSVP